jgi:hypothetical protein
MLGIRYQVSGKAGLPVGHEFMPSLPLCPFAPLPLCVKFFGSHQQQKNVCVIKLFHKIHWQVNKINSLQACNS